MKRLTVFFLLFLALGLVFVTAQDGVAQSESALPSFDVFFLVLLLVSVLVWLVGIIWVYLQVWPSGNTSNWKYLWLASAVLLPGYVLLLYYFIGIKKRLPGKKESTARAVEESAKQAQPLQGSFSQPDIYASPDYKSTPSASKPIEAEKKLPSSFSQPVVQGGFSSARQASENSVAESKEQILQKFKRELSSFAGEKKERPDDIVLTENEKQDVQLLLGLILPEKNSYSKEEVLSVILEKGYSPNVARKVVKEIYK